MKKLAAVPLVVALAVAGATGGASAEVTIKACPGFRVLHDDRIGAAILPAGRYAITPFRSGGVTCSSASRLFARFLEDYDGVLPHPWLVVPEGTGQASFLAGKGGGFRVFRNAGGGGGRSPLGALCRGGFTVNTSGKVGPLFFTRGGYLLYVPPHSAIGCRRAAALFTRFLGTPGGRLPSPWRVIAQTATFYKPAHPTRSAFRVEPVGGAGSGIAARSG